MFNNDEIARQIAERLYPEVALEARIEALQEEALHWHNCRERLHTEIRAIIGKRDREQRSGDADGDLIEDVRAAVAAS